MRNGAESKSGTQTKSVWFKSTSGSKMRLLHALQNLCSPISVFTNHIFRWLCVRIYGVCFLTGKWLSSFWNARLPRWRCRASVLASFDWILLRVVHSAQQSLAQTLFFSDTEVPYRSRVVRVSSVCFKTVCRANKCFTLGCLVCLRVCIDFVDVFFCRSLYCCFTSSLPSMCACACVHICCVFLFLCLCFDWSEWIKNWRLFALWILAGWLFISLFSPSSVRVCVPYIWVTNAQVNECEQLD